MKLILFSCFSAFLFIIIPCCHNQQKLNVQEYPKETTNKIKENDLQEIVSSKSKAVYLSYDKLNPDFGTINLLDLNSKKRVQLFDNRFYNSNPIFFETGDKILFASAQKGDPLFLKGVKHHAERQLYLIDCNDLSILTYYYNSGEPGENPVLKFTGLSWDASRKQVYFSNDDNNIYKTDDDETQLKLLYTLDKDILIWHLELSPNEKYIAISYDDFNKQNSGIFVYDISSSKIIYDIKSTDKFVQLLGWSYDNQIYYQKDSLAVFNFISNSSKTIDFNLNKDSLKVKKIFAEDEDCLILFVDKLKYDPVVKYSVTTSTEIARYNFKSQKMDWLTNDGTKKEDLDIYISQNH